ncbi:MAG: AbrB/MazE/SpoVT family DNA-binding domain-containing protein [Candidatus Binataceae bacterium]
MSSSKVTRNGQTTIPIEIRKHLRLKTGDRIEFVVERDGKVAIIPKTVDIKSLYGILSPAPRRASLNEMEEAIWEGAAASD